MNSITSRHTTTAQIIKRHITTGTRWFTAVSQWFSQQLWINNSRIIAYHTQFIYDSADLLSQSHISDVKHTTQSTSLNSL